MIANIFFLFYFSLLHPLHLSVCDIHHNAENKSLEITQRIFADDLEDALRKFSGEKIDVLNPPQPERLRQILGAYMEQHFSLSLNEKPAQLTYLGYEQEEDAIWVYLELKKVGDFRSITVKNTVLFEMFDDQTNIINIKKDGRIRSLKLEPKKQQDRLSY